METLCRLYLELANVMPKDCLSSRDLAAKEQIDGYGIALMMIAEGCADPSRVAADTLNKFVGSRRR